MVSVGVVGLGYWGPKLTRNFHDLEGAQLEWVCDFRKDRLESLSQSYPEVKTTRSFDELLDSSVEAISLATPASTHAQLASRALRSGKHVLIEKPIALSVSEARDLIELAQSCGKILMVGHTFIYNPAVQAVKQLIQSGGLGEIYYISGCRLNLGLFQPDINVLWDLAPHDVSMLLYWLDEDPLRISAWGGAYVQKERGIHDVATISAIFPSGIYADVRVSWLDPVKTRKYTIVGSKKMLVYDDIADTDKLLIYDKGVEIPPYSTTEQEFRASYHQGEGVAYPVNWIEPLETECRHFIECIETGTTPITDGISGLRVVRVLETADLSLRDGGAWLELLPFRQPEIALGSDH